MVECATFYKTVSQNRSLKLASFSAVNTPPVEELIFYCSNSFAGVIFVHLKISVWCVQPTFPCSIEG